ncbi:MAG: glycosyltransferase family 39 protein, partial [Anaerolineales bacterium]|nr:glycosyltransferase family 39 protein [Anaerolineales bacterium]
VISNDIPVAALCTLSFWLLWRVVKKPTLTRGLAAGVAIGLALLTKISALPLLPIALVAFAWLWQRQQEKRVVWLVTAVTLLSALLIAGWWFGRAWYLYGTPFGLTAHDQAPWAFSETFQRDGLGQQWLDVFESFWASIGWSPTQFHDNVYWLLLGLVLLALVGLGKELWQGWRNPNLVTNLRQNPQPLFLFLFLFMLGATALALEAWMRRVSAPFGRLLFPALAPIIILLWLGWRAIHPYLAHLLLLIVAVLAILAPIHIIWPAYHPQQLPAAAFAQTETLNWQFGDMAQLLRVTPQQSSAQANSTLPVEVCWRTLARAQSDYLVFIHLVGPDNAVIAHRDTIPGLGTYPTTAWQPDTYFCDRIEVRLWDNIPQTLVYNIEVGLIDVGREARLPIYDQAGNPMSNAFAGQVKVAAAAEAAISLPPRQSTTPAIDVLRVDTPLTWSINTTQAITVAWGVYEDIAIDYQVFAHLIDSQSGELITQSDGAPFAGWYNTSWWSGGTVVVEKRPFPIPDTAPPGTYTLIVGLYNLQTGERLVEKQAAVITLQR